MKQPFFIFDVESIGLHGDEFAVGGGIYVDGRPIKEFLFATHPNMAAGPDYDRVWVKQNIPPIKSTHDNTGTMRMAFWKEWVKAKKKFPGIIMAAECGWPVDARFLAKCIDDRPFERKLDGPYPLHEIATYMTAAGMDPMLTYKRLASELPPHNPLHDARQSARLLFAAITWIAAKTEINA
jgi:hypothetical protein